MHEISFFCLRPLYTQYLTDEMVEAAINQNAEVQHVFAELEAFDQYGIGARLRFTV